MQTPDSKQATHTAALPELQPAELILTDQPINAAVDGDSRWLVSVKGAWARKDGSPSVHTFTAKLLVSCSSAYTAPELALSYLYRLGACARPEVTKACGVELLSALGRE